MKSISYKAIKNGRGYIVTGLPANRSESRAGGSWGMFIAGGLLLLTTALVCLLLLAP